MINTNRHYYYLNEEKNKNNHRAVVSKLPVYCFVVVVVVGFCINHHRNRMNLMTSEDLHLTAELATNQSHYLSDLV